MIDALRASAALMVLVSHSPQLGGVQHGQGLAGVMEHLSVGVWLFFAVSGYLIAGPFLRALMTGGAAPSVRRYAVRRAARILPAYWVAFAALLLLTKGRLVTAGWQVPTHWFLIQGLIPGQLQTVYFVAWTLSIEVMFYVLVPVVTLAVMRLTAGRELSASRLAGGIAILWLSAVLVEVALAVSFPFHGFKPLPGVVQLLGLLGPLSCFCPGMLVFVAETAANGDSAWVRGYRWLGARPLLTLPLAIALFVLASLLPIQTSHVLFEFSHPLVGVGSGLVIACALRAGDWIRPIARVLAPLGLISYGIYLWHWVVLQVILQQHGWLLPGAGGRHVLGNLLVLLVLTLPLAALSWLVIERPLIRHTTGWDRPTPTPGIAAQPIPQAALAPIDA